MNVEQVNSQALDFLCKGDFDSAQYLLYQNAKQNPCCQTYNNLGSFLYDNGMTLKNGKNVSAVAYAKRYVKKAFEYDHSSTVVSQNLGRMYYEENDYINACHCFSLAYANGHNEKILFNKAISLFALHRYLEAYECFQMIKPLFPEAVFPYLLTMAICDKESLLCFQKTNEYREFIQQMDLLDQMIFFYFGNQYQKILEIEPELNKSWSLRESDWAILVDALIQLGQEETIRPIIEEKLSNYDSFYEKSLYQSVTVLLNEVSTRKEVIKEYFNTLSFPQIILCNYFGCEAHHTPWD